MAFLNTEVITANMYSIPLLYENAVNIKLLKL